MRDIRPCATKQHSELASEWDELAEERHRQIVSGEDLSFEYVLAPTTLQLFENADARLVLDVGSGTGDLTVRLAQVATTVIGIEPSYVSVVVARAHSVGAHNVQFIHAPIEEAASMFRIGPATAAVACMTLMTTPDLRAFAQALGPLLQDKAKFVAVLSHPWFWPRYWGYESETWFSYPKEVFIEAPFAISKCHTKVRTTHIHRPLEQYIRVFADAGFRLETLVEPMPSAEIQALYPQTWWFPRFIGLRWVRTA